MLKITKGVLVVATIGGCLAPAGCAGPDPTGPAQAVAGFARSVAGSDGAAACALLSPKVAEEVAESQDQPCAEAILKLGLPAPAPVRSTRVQGRSAFVTTDTDTVFLSEFDAGWQIIGVGCRQHGDAPYDCTVSGG